MSQANTKEGDILALAAEDLNLETDLLLCACQVNGVLAVRRPFSGDIPIYVLIYGAKLNQHATVRPLYSNRSVRVFACGGGLAGEPLRAMIDGSGRVTSATRAAGRLIGIAEEPFKDGQLVRMRPV